MGKELEIMDAPVVKRSPLDIVGMIHAKWHYRMNGDQFGVLAVTLAQSDVAQCVELDRIYDTRTP